MATDFRLQWYFNEQVYEMTLTEHNAVLIGRDNSCDVTVPDDRISRRQAILTLIPQGDAVQAELRNISTSNKIYFRHPEDQQPLPQGEQISLTPGAVFQMGTAQFRVIEGTPGHDGPVVVCWNCERKVDVTMQDCPWCGVNLAFGKVES